MKNEIKLQYHLMTLLLLLLVCIVVLSSCRNKNTEPLPLENGTHVSVYSNSDTVEENNATRSNSTYTINTNWDDWVPTLQVVNSVPSKPITYKTFYTTEFFRNRSPKLRFKSIDQPQEAIFIGGLDKEDTSYTIENLQTDETKVLSSRYLMPIGSKTLLFTAHFRKLTTQNGQLLDVGRQVSPLLLKHTVSKAQITIENNSANPRTQGLKVESIELLNVPKYIGLINPLSEYKESDYFTEQEIRQHNEIIFWDNFKKAKDKGFDLPCNASFYVAENYPKTKERQTSLKITFSKSGDNGQLERKYTIVPIGKVNEKGIYCIARNTLFKIKLTINGWDVSFRPQIEIYDSPWTVSEINLPAFR